MGNYVSLWGELETAAITLGTPCFDINTPIHHLHVSASSDEGWLRGDYWHFSLKLESRPLASAEATVPLGPARTYLIHTASSSCPWDLIGRILMMWKLIEILSSGVWLQAPSRRSLQMAACFCVLLFRAPVYWKLASGPAHSDATTGLAYLTRWKWVDFPSCKTLSLRASSGISLFNQYLMSEPFAR